MSTQTTETPISLLDFLRQKKRLKEFVLAAYAEKTDQVEVLSISQLAKFLQDVLERDSESVYTINTAFTWVNTNAPKVWKTLNEESEGRIWLHRDLIKYKITETEFYFQELNPLDYLQCTGVCNEELLGLVQELYQQIGDNSEIEVFDTPILRVEDDDGDTRCVRNVMSKNELEKMHQYLLDQ